MLLHIKAATLKLWAIALVLLIVTGVAVSALRLATPLLSAFRGELEQRASAALGQPVHIGQLRAQWRGLGPELALSDVRLDDTEGRTRLRLNQVVLRLALQDVIRDRSLLPWRLVLRDLELQLTRDNAGRLHLSGLGSSEQTTDDSDPAGLLALRRVLIENARLRYHDASGQTPDAQLDDIDLLLRNRDNQHRLALRAALPDGGRLRLVADLDTPADANRWGGRIYLRSDPLDLAPWQALLPGLPLRIEQAPLAIEVWSDWQDGRLQQLQGRLSLARLSVDAPDQTDPPWQVTQLSGDFRLTPSADSTRLQLSGLRFARDGQPRPATGLALEWSDEGHWRANAGLALIDDWAGLARLALPELRARLDRLRPVGRVHDLRLDWRDSEHWQLSAALHGLGWQADDPLPGASEIGAQLYADAEGGQLRIDSRGVQADLRPLFRWPLQLQRLTGDLRWRRLADGGWQVLADGLHARSPHIDTRTRLDLQLPADAPAFLDLQTDFVDGDASHTPPYYPSGIMDEALVAWLDRAFVSGRVSSGTALVRGPLADFPYEKTRNGHFEVLFGVEDLILDYAEGWPRLEEVAAEVRFHNNRLDIRLDQAKYLGSDIIKANAEIPSLDPTDPMRIRGVVAGPLQNGLRLLAESPLAEDFGPIAKVAKAEGQARIALDFSVPLDAKRGQHRLDGQIDFDGNRLLLPEWDFALQDIKGTLELSLGGLRADDISARLLGSPATLSVRTGKDGITRIDANTRLDSRQLSPYLPKGPLQTLIDGRSDWRVRLGVPKPEGRAKPVSLELNSNLSGTRIDLPAPLGKSSNERRPLALRTTLGAKSMPLRLDYGDLHADLQLADNGLQSGLLQLGPRQQIKPPKQGLRLTGRLPRLDVRPWLDWFEKQPPGGTDEGLPFSADLRLTQLLLPGITLDQLTLKLSSLERGWQANLDSQQLRGVLQLPRDARRDPLKARIDRLALDLNPDAIEPSAEKSALDPRDLPALDLRIDQLQINGHDFGQLRLDGKRSDAGINLQRFELRGEPLRIDANGQWLLNDGKPLTALQFTIDSPDFGRALEWLGFTPQLNGGVARIGGNLGWPDSPLSLDRAHLSGKLDMRITDGRFVEVSPGVGRVLGLLNIAALQRRLSLDFSDLFKKGFSFDRIEGNFSLANGDAFTNNLQINGPAARILISGRTGLASRDYDQLVSVTPSVTATLPVAGALAGGPIGAGVALLAQKLIGKQVDKLAAQTRYSVVGPWDEPTVKRLSGGGLLSRITGAVTPDNNDQATTDEGTPAAQ